jgi:hypothetical protein
LFIGLMDTVTHNRPSAITVRQLRSPAKIPDKSESKVTIFSLLTVILCSIGYLPICQLDFITYLTIIS